MVLMSSGAYFTLVDLSAEISKTTLSLILAWKLLLMAAQSV